MAAILSEKRKHCYTQLRCTFLLFLIIKERSSQSGFPFLLWDSFRFRKQRIWSIIPFRFAKRKKKPSKLLGIFQGNFVELVSYGSSCVCLRAHWNEMKYSIWLTLNYIHTQTHTHTNTSIHKHTHKHKYTNNPSGNHDSS